MANPTKTIVCIGAGYVGGPTMAVIAAKCPDFRVVVVDINSDRIRAWQSGTPPIFEPGLQGLLDEALGRNLFFSDDIPAAIRDADIIFVSVNTPTKTFGEGAGMAADLQYWERTAREILDNSDRDKIVVEKSTVPVRTAQAMERILNSGGKDVHFDVLSNPEFMAEGTAISDLLNPDRVLIGGHDTERGQKAVQTMVDIYAAWVPRERILTTDVWSAELSKLASNAFLAQRISSINSISAFCERTGANVDSVAEAIGMDKRIGSKFLRAGIGFGGSCFKKDIMNLVYLCEHHGLELVARYWRLVVEMNEYQKERFVCGIVESLFNTVVDKRIAIFGVAFKADTGDTRESPALYVIRQLLEEKAIPVITDPEALENAKIDLADAGDRVIYEPDPYAAAAGAQGLAVLTDWDLYRTLDYEKIFESMEKPAFIFDGRNLLDSRALFDIGFNVVPIGQPALTRF